MRGLIIEMATLLAVVLGIYMAIRFSGEFATFIKNNVQWDEKHIEIAAFVTILFGISIGVMFLGKLLTRITHFVALGFLNRMLGAVFSAIKATLIIGSVFMFSQQSQISKSWIKQLEQTSLFYTPIVQINRFIYNNVLEKNLYTEENNNNNIKNHTNYVRE